MMLDRGELLKSLRALKRGDFTVRMPLNLTGIDGEIAQTFNDVVELEEAKAQEIARVADQVGKEGQTAARMNVPGASGSWVEVIDAINTLISDTAYPMQEVARADDQHTLILGHIGTLAVNPYIFDKLPYDANKDFKPVSLLAKVPSLYVVHPDVPAKNLKASLAVPAFLGLTADVIVIGDDVWVRTSMGGTKWSHSTNDMMGSPLPIPTASAGVEEMIDKLKEALATEGVVTKKLADVACGDRQCYQVSISVPSSLMDEAGAVASLDPASIFGDAVEINLLFDREKLWLTEVSSGVASDEIGTISATLSFSSFDEAVEFSPPPSPDVTEGEFTIPGM